MGRVNRLHLEKAASKLWKLTQQSREVSKSFLCTTTLMIRDMREQ